MVEITVDASDLMGKITTLKENMSQENFDRAMYGVMQRTSRRVSTILRKDLPQEYVVKPGNISKAVQRPKLSTGAGGVGCSIPIKDTRGVIGNRYSAVGGAHGWNSLRRKYRVKARIVTRGQSTLPQKMKTGYAPFRNLGSSLGGLTFVRRSKKRGPLDIVTGIAIPQMPMNRSQEDVQRDIKLFLEKQIDQRIRYMLMSGK